MREHRTPVDRAGEAVASAVVAGAVWVYRKCNAGAAEPCYLGHVLAENDHGLIVGACVTEAGTRAEREAALALLDHAAQGQSRTLGADKQYQERSYGYSYEQWL